MGDTTMSSAVLKIFRPHSSCASTPVFHKSCQCYKRFTRSFTYCQLSQFQHYLESKEKVSNCHPNLSWQSTQTTKPRAFWHCRSPSGVSLTKRPEMARKMLGFKRANPKNTGSFFFVGMGRNNTRTVEQLAADFFSPNCQVADCLVSKGYHRKPQVRKKRLQPANFRPIQDFLASLVT